MFQNYNFVLQKIRYMIWFEQNMLMSRFHVKYTN